MKSRKLAALGLLFMLASCTAQAEPVVIEAGTNSVIPKPVRDELREGWFALNGDAVIVAADPAAAELAAYLNEYLGPLLGSELAVSDTAPRGGGTITLRTGQSTSIAAEGYRLTVAADGIAIDASDRGGLFNGIQTLLQLLPPEVYTVKIPVMKVAPSDRREVHIPCRAIDDFPRFAYRGMMLDVARTFFTKEQMIQYIDWLSHHKINKLHWHLADDEGWRVEIKAYPELAEQAGFRGPGLPVPAIYGAWDRPYGGYYTQDEIREVVAYAARRNVEIIPEIDLPGHSRAVALVHPEILCPGPRSMTPGYDYRNVWCASKEANYEMLEVILGELVALFPSAYIHVGGDEVLPGQWAACPDCSKIGGAAAVADRFSERMHKILAAHGKKMAVWNETVKGGKLPKESLVSGWENAAACRDATDKGYKTVVMPGSFFYFDMRQAPTETGQVWAGLVPFEKPYSFRFDEQGFDAARMQNVAGVEAAFFSEIALSQPDSWSYLQYMSYPRICALAEVGWCSDESRVWSEFYGRLTGDHLARLDAMGIGFRMFPPVLEYKNGTVTAFPAVDSAVMAMGVTPEAVPMIRLAGTIAGGATQTLELNLADCLDRNGLWNVTVFSSREEVTINRIEVKTAAGVATVVGYAQKVNPLNAFKLRATDANRKGTLRVTVKNSAARPADVRVELTKSPYIEPKVTFTSTLGENAKFPFSRVAGYIPSSYARTAGPPRKGDTFTYTFAAPVTASAIEVATGLYYMPRYLLWSGHVEVSYDGTTWERAADLEAGRATIHPARPVRAVRIVSTATGNGENAVALQMLKIKS